MPVGPNAPLPTWSSIGWTLIHPSQGSLGARGEHEPRMRGCMPASRPRGRMRAAGSPGPIRVWRPMLLDRGGPGLRERSPTRDRGGHHFRDLLKLPAARRLRRRGPVLLWKTWNIRRAESHVPREGVDVNEGRRNGRRLSPSNKLSQCPLDSGNLRTPELVKNSRVRRRGIRQSLLTRVTPDRVLLHLRGQHVRKLMLRTRVNKNK